MFHILIFYYSLTPKEVMTVGDSTNDVTLVKGEWHGVAVGDGKEMLKKVNEATNFLIEFYFSIRRGSYKVGSTPCEYSASMKSSYC